MRVTRFHAKNFLILKDLVLEDLRGFNVFIGPNATGKSTVLQALDALLENDRIGFSSDSPFRGSSGIPIELAADVDFSPDDIETLVHSAADGQLRVPSSDVIMRDLQHNLATKITFGYAALAPRLPEQGVLSFGKYARAANRPVGELLRQGLTQETVSWLSQSPPLHGPIESGLTRFAGDCTLYLPTTRSTPHSFPVGRPVKPAPSSVGQWLQVQQGEKSPQFEGYEKGLSQMLPHAQGIIFKPDQGNQLRWGMSEEGLPGMSPAEYWSSGTKHLSMFLGLLAEAPAGTVALVEEPELSLRPSAISKLVGEMHTMSESGRIQFFITTHSPIVTYGLDPAQKDHSLWSFRRNSDASAGATRCETEQQIEDAVNSLLRP